MVTSIARAFVDNCEFKDQQFRGLLTEEMVHEFFAAMGAARQSNSVNEFAELNLCIYVLIRDSKLIELRSRLEQQSTMQPRRVVQFLFKICQRNGLDFSACLDRIREQESEVYLHLNKIAKELGLKEPH